MIQRIQSLFLLLCSASFFGLFGLPFATSSVSMPDIFSDMVYNISDNAILLGLCVLGGLVSLGAIFLYNNRELQIKISYVATVLAILLPLTAFLLIYNEGTGGANADKIDDAPGLYLPLVGIIFSVLAARFIRKDENTVRSMDRLR